MSSGKTPKSAPVAQWQRIQQLVGQAGLPALQPGRVIGMIRPLERTGEELEALLRSTVEVWHRGDLVQKALGGSRGLLLMGSVDGAQFTAHVYDRPVDPDEPDSPLERVAEFDLQHETDHARAAGTIPAEAAFQFCDKVMGDDPDRFAAYIAHRLSRAKGKRAAKLLALLSTVVADKLRDDLD